MKSLFSTRAIWLTLVLLSPLTPQRSTVFAQGSLTPPGAPGPTFKTLSQVEPRTAIVGTTSVAINAAGSYYLTANLNVTGGTAINITANNVTLDLNGFTVSSTAPNATGTGILLASGLADITILNGHIKGGVTNNAGVYNGSGFASGITYFGSTPSNVRVAGVSVSGCSIHGIYLSTVNSTVVESCTVQTVGGSGIVASSVSHSTAYECGNYAIYADLASECSGYGTGSDSGVYATTANNCFGFNTGNGMGVRATTANNCYAESVSDTALSANTANNCSGASSSGTGLYATIAIGCYGTSSGGTGLSATTANNCYGTTSSGTGLYATIAIGCYGTSSGGIGLNAFFIANSCYGYSSSGTGLSTTTANNCYGEGSGRGVFATTANNCYGYSASGVGLYVVEVAIGSDGESSTNGTGLHAFIANSCTAGGAPALDVTHKYNMP